MYLPVTPAKTRHRRSLNLLEVPQPHHGSQAKQSKVEAVDCFIVNIFLSS